MICRLSLRAVAAAVIVSILVTIPGAPAWAQTASMARSGSIGVSGNGAAASASSLGAPIETAFSIPQLALSASSLGHPSLAPVPAALSAAVLTRNIVGAPLSIAAAPSAPAANDGRAVPAALTAVPLSAVASIAATVSNLAPALDAARSAPSAEGKSDGVRGRLSAFFDGMIARKPVQDAVEGGQNGDSRRVGGLNGPRQLLLPVLVTLVDPGTPEGLQAVLQKMSADLGFRLDYSFDAIRAPGILTVRGAIPVSSLVALKQTPGVIDVAAAVGRVSAMAPLPYQAPASENLLRAGLRKLIIMNPMMGLVAMLPLQFAIMVAFMGPVMGGLMLGGTAAVLKPWMLGTAFGMAASFSFLAPLFAWIPLKLRIGATYVAASMLAWSFYTLAPGLPALWLTGNLLLSALATIGSLKTLASARNSHPVDKAVNSTQAAAFLNILGYQALLPILILAGMMPLAYGILAISTALALALLIKTGTKALPASSLVANSLSAPATPYPNPAPEKPEASTPNSPAKKPVHEPFVPATRVIATMEKLLETNPAEALKVAAAAIVNEKERRSEVKIGAQRILAALPIAQTLPHYLDLLKLTARSGVQLSKEVNIDPWWYLQRTALKRLSSEAATLKPGTPELIDALKASYKDRNASVRLATADVLITLGVDPGPEPIYETARTTPAPVMQPAPGRTPAPQAPKKNVFLKWLSIALLAGMLGWMSLGNHAPTTPPPVNPPTITQTIKPADSTAEAKSADAVKADPKDAALNQIAKDTKRTADAAERTAKASEDMAKPKGSFMSTLFWTLAPIILMVWLFRKFMGGGSAGGIKMKPKMDLEKPTTRFDDVAGIDESLVEVQEIIDFLRDPARFNKLGARMPKGILMEGPPGTGKTLLARALAGETDATFISISGSDFVELYVGMGARRVRELFETARKSAPAIIFIDEIDAVGKKRGDGGPGGGSNDEREQTINQILKEMDGFDNSSGVLVVAATNRADTLDAALTRPGRFDRKIHVGLPEAMGREAILALHAKRARLGPDVDLRLIARRTAGLSGAFLENVINEATLLAARRGGDSVSAADIDEAVDRATIGGKRSLRLSEPLKLRIGRHEVGHVAANLLNEKPELRVPVNKVTIIPHGSGALGFAESGSEEGDKYLYTRGELEARLDTALGGLVAEKLFYGEWSTGPGSDLESATRVARAMVQQLGMSEEMGLAQTAPNQYGQSTFGGETDARALVEINKLLKTSMERVERRLTLNKDKFEALVAALIEKETLSSDEIQAILHPKPK